jgi:hypothetical protein
MGRKMASVRAHRRRAPRDDIEDGEEEKEDTLPGMARKGKWY